MVQIIAGILVVLVWIAIANANKQFRDKTGINLPSRRQMRYIRRMSLKKGVSEQKYFDTWVDNKQKTLSARPELPETKFTPETKRTGCIVLLAISAVFILLIIIGIFADRKSTSDSESVAPSATRPDASTHKAKHKKSVAKSVATPSSGAVSESAEPLTSTETASSSAIGAETTEDTEPTYNELVSNCVQETKAKYPKDDRAFITISCQTKYKDLLDASSDKGSY